MTVQPPNRSTVALLPLVFVLVLAPVTLPCSVRADDERYSLGAVQAATELDVAAGEATTTWLGFYNIDGTVPTRIELVVVSHPDGWKVTLSRDRTSDGSQQLVFTVDPSSPAAHPHDCALASTRPVWLSGRGHVCAEVAWLRIEAPAAGPGPGNGKVVVLGVATWPGHGAFRQEREFAFDVRQVESEDQPRGSVAAPLAVGTLAVLVALLLLRLLAKSH